MHVGPGGRGAQRGTLLVPDVHRFPGHIACDAASRSEIVVPLIAAEGLLGVLDIDSPLPGRFDAADARGLESLASQFMAGARQSPTRPALGGRPPGPRPPGSAPRPRPPPFRG